jgi:hypothetical protein
LIGVLSLPVLLLTALLTRTGIAPIEAHVPLVALGLGLGLLALAFAIYSLTDIWHSGADGAKSAIIGLLYSAPALAILALIAAAAVIYPPLADVSTDVMDPPELTEGGASLSDWTGESTAARQQEAYPELVPHRYPFSPQEVFSAAQALVEDRGWLVVDQIPPTLTGQVPAAFGESAASDEIAAIIEPPPMQQDGVIRAVARTLAFGFPDDVTIRVREDEDGTRVDMRSASRIGSHDLGQNARRVRRFLADLDARIQASAGPPSAPSPSPAPVPEDVGVEAAEEPPSE